eukprot:EG_transcript_6751
MPMYGKPQPIDSLEVVKAATDQAIILWLWWGFPAGGRPKDDDKFYCYPRLVCEALTKALDPSSEGRVTVNNHQQLPASGEYPASDKTREVEFWLRTDSELYIQANTTETWRQRQCFPYPVRWMWNKGNNPDKEADWELFPVDVAWALERAFANRNITYRFKDSSNISRVVRLVGYPMFQMPEAASLRKRLVRRDGPNLHPSWVHMIRGPSATKAVSCERNWMRLDPGQPPPPRLRLAPHFVEQFQRLMDRATQWYSFPKLAHCRVGCVPGSDKQRTQRLQVVAVEKVQVPALWQAYAAARLELSERGRCGPLFPQASELPLLTATHFDAAQFYTEIEDPVAQLEGRANEVLLFHGAPREVIQKVTHSDETFGGLETAGETVPRAMNERTADFKAALGRGIYFADLASKSNLYVPCPNCGRGAYQNTETCECSSPPEYQMLLCRVLLGRVRQENEIRGANANYYKDAERLQEVVNGCDSVFVEMNEQLRFENSCAFREWAVYAAWHVYPEFVITYTRHAS